MSRLAIIGYGQNAKKHISVFRELGCDIVAACNRSKNGQLSAANEGGIKRTYSDIREMLSQEQPDGVICTPSIYENFSVAQQVMPFSIPTLLEKPAGTSLEELAALQQSRDQYNTPLMVGINRLWYSVLQHAIDDAGGLEKINTVTVEWSENPQHLQKRGFTAEQIALRVFCNSIHGLSLLTFLAGPILDPDVVGLDKGGFFRWVMSLQGVSERGVMASFNSTWDSPCPWRLQFCVADRRYVFAPLEKCLVYEFGQREAREIEPAQNGLKFKPGFYNQARAFLNMIETRKIPQGASLDDMTAPMNLADRLTKACLG